PARAADPRWRGPCQWLPRRRQRPCRRNPPIHPPRKGRSGIATECYMPSGARIDPHWTYRGLPAVRLENRWMAVEVLPDAGAKIFRLIDKVADRNVLWENKRIPPHRAPVFASMDEHWSGGCDEILLGGAQYIVCKCVTTTYI